MRPQPVGTFEDDARADRLPAVSWIMPTSHQSEHPDYLPAAGADFVAQKIEAIASNPKVWAKTAFILNYDENDGLFDHVAPPTPKAGTADEFVGGLPIGGGFRVPAIIISPWTVGGWVASEAFDHTSALRFLEQFTGVEEPNITRVAPPHVRRPDLGVPVQHARAPAAAAAGRHGEAAGGGEAGGGHAAEADAARGRPDLPPAGAGAPAARVSPRPAACGPRPELPRAGGLSAPRGRRSSPDRFASQAEGLAEGDGAPERRCGSRALQSAKAWADFGSEVFKPRASRRRPGTPRAERPRGP